MKQNKPEIEYTLGIILLIFGMCIGFQITMILITSNFGGLATHNGLIKIDSINPEPLEIKECNCQLELNQWKNLTLQCLNQLDQSILLTEMYRKGECK